MKNNRYIYRVASVFSIIFICVGAYLGYFTAVESKKIVMNPYNKRLDHLETEVVRGNIYDAQGVLLATSEEGGRNYPYGSTYAHAIGYVGHGKVGVEAMANVELLYPDYNARALLNYAFAGEKFKGHDVYLTLDHTLQEAAQKGLDGRKGAAIVLEPRTGKIRAMYATPGFNPNKISVNWDNLTQDTEESPLLNRATQGLYPPGSTFKILTTIAYLEEKGDVAFNFEYNCKGSITKDNHQIKCNNGKAHGVVNLESAFAKSCNTYFIELTDQVPIAKLKQVADKLLFNQELPVKVEYKKSQFSLNANSSSFDKLITYIGQGETLVSPLHLAMIGSILYNDGVLMVPYMIDYSLDTKGEIALKNLPEYQGTYLDEKTCSTLKSLMTKVVTEGTGNRLYRKDMLIGGKTGTAQNETSKDHSLFVGFVEPKDTKKESLVLAVVVEQGGQGAKALDVSQTIIEAYAQR